MTIQIQGIQKLALKFEFYNRKRTSAKTTELAVTTSAKEKEMLRINMRGEKIRNTTVLVIFWKHNDLI
jgi:hypothetical protein